MTVDTGATINVSDVKTFDNKPQTKFLFKNMTTFAYNTQARADFLGKFDAVIETEKRISVPTFYVMKNHEMRKLWKFIVIILAHK